MMSRHFLPVLLLLAATPAFALDPLCDESGALQVAQSDPAVVKFCAAVKDGCTYKIARLPLAESSSANTYRLTASQIHSIDEQGQPRFMPEGFIFARVSDDCKVTKVYGSVPEPPEKKE